MMRILVVSDVRIVQEGLHSVLEQRDEVDVVSTTDLRHAGDQSAQLRPDVVLLDAAHGDSLELVKDLVASATDSRVVAFGVKETEEEGILALAAAGTAGYVRDNAESCDLVRVLERVMCDELPCSARAAASFYRHVATLSHAGNDPAGDRDDSAVPLSRRELQIAHLIECGLTNKAIGRKLGIEAATVKNHVHNLCEKLHVHRRGAAVARIRALLRAGYERTPLPASAPANPALEAS
jgi:two-component system, NarL family, nitrate/nitrite response regulator NarL